MEKYGIEVFKSAALAVVEVIAVLHEVFVEKKGLWKLFGLQGVVQTIIGLDFAKLKLEVSDFSEAEREDVEKAVKAKLPASFQGKVGQGIDLVEEVVDLGEDIVAFAQHSYAGAVALFAKVKLFLGV